MSKRIDTYSNRYGDVFEFEHLDDGNMLMRGNFTFARVGYGADYSRAFEQYCSDGGKLSLDEFRAAVIKPEHTEDGHYTGVSEFHKRYAYLVDIDRSHFDMIDPSGGPYIAVGTTIFGKKVLKLSQVSQNEILLVCIGSDENINK